MLKLTAGERTLSSIPKVPDSFLNVLNFQERNIVKSHDLCEGVRYPIVGVHETLPQKDSGKIFIYLEVNNPEDVSETIYVWAPARAQKALAFPKGEMFIKMCDYVYSGISPNGFPKVTILERVVPNTAPKAVKRKRKVLEHPPITESDAPVLASTSATSLMSIENMITDAMSVSGLDVDVTTG